LIDPQGVIIAFTFGGLVPMAKVSLIIKKHRAAATEQRKEHSNPKKARAFLIRAGILTKSGKRLRKQYR
jgi:hypothetical protein